MDGRIELSFPKTKYGTKSKDGARSTSVNLSAGMLELIEELRGGGNRSNWIEKACWLMAALQSGDEDMLRVWKHWLWDAIDDDNVPMMEFERRLRWLAKLGV